jgi:cysteine desulfurase / selenocysteine lyase
MSEVVSLTQSLAPRSDFPVLSDVTYLNVAAIGLTPVGVLDSMTRFLREIAGSGTVHLDDETEARLYEAPRQTAADLMGAQPAEIAIMTSATEAIGQVAWSLFPDEGSNVVSLDIEFPSVTYPWIQLAKRTGMELRLVKAGGDSTEPIIEKIAAAVDRNTAAICISHVQYATGHRLDPTALSQLAHSFGAVLILDTTQSAGVVSLDVKQTDQDVVIASAYKWLCGPLGGAFCYVRPELWPRLQPPFAAARSSSTPTIFDGRTLELANDARRLEYATMSYASAIGLATAIDYLVDIGIDQGLAHVHALGDMLIRGLTELQGEIVTPIDRRDRAGVITCTFPGRNSNALAAKLAEQSIVVAPRFGGIRFSPHVFNTADDIERALDALQILLAPGR